MPGGHSIQNPLDHKRVYFKPSRAKRRRIRIRDVKRISQLSEGIEVQPPSLCPAEGVRESE